MSTVIPFGYGCKESMATLKSLMQDSDTYLADIRKSPRTGYAGFNDYELKAAFGDRYVPVLELGNVNHSNGGPIKLVRQEKGIDRLIKGLNKGYRLILLCGCADYNQCHRRLVVELLQEKMLDVEVVLPDSMRQSSMVRCISIRQPYASWLSNPGSFINAQLAPKRIENRDWTTKYRGPVLIHASRTFEDDAIPFWLSRCPQLDDAVSLKKEDYRLGCIIGKAELVKVITTSDPEARDPWFCGQYGFLLAYAQPIDPIPYPGALKLFEIPESFLEKHGVHI